VRRSPKVTIDGVVEVVNHVVFADPENEPARSCKPTPRTTRFPERVRTVARLLSHRRHGTAIERHGLAGLSGNALASGIVSSMTPELLLDLIGVRLNGPRSATRDRGRLVVVDRGDERWSFGVRHGVLHARRDVRTSAPVGVISSIAAFAVFATGSKNFE